MESNSSRIQELARLNRGRLTAPAYLALLASTLEVTVTADDLLSLADTDAFMEGYRAAYRNLDSSPTALRRYFPDEETARLQRMLACAADALGSEQVVLFTAPGEDCGAVRVEAATTLRAFRSILDMDGDSLQLMSHDGTNGILLEWNDGDADQTYELAAWGPRWFAILKTCPS